jgi:hypothetical protein
MHTNFIKRLKNLSPKKSSERGFSLADMMIAGVITSAVVSVSGYGVAAMIDSSTTANSKTERRVEMNRAIDFIATEVRGATSIVKDVSTATVPTAFSPDSTKVDVSTVQKVLMINVPGTASDTPIIYYVAKPVDGNWKGPRVVYRWGPAFDSTGNYSNAATVADWKSEPLIDKIANGGPTPSCSSGSLNGTSGFYSCVDDSGKTATIFQSGVINKTLGRSASYGVNSIVGTRSTNVANSQFSPTSGAATVATFTKIGGTINIAETSTMAVKLLGGDITCGAGGPNIPTSATINLSGETALTQAVPSTSEYTYTVQPNTSLNMTGLAAGVNSSGSCKNYSYSANTLSNAGTQVLTLVDGDTVPTFTPLGGQRSIDTFLQPYISTTTGKVVLEKNQVLFLFELGSTDPRSPAYDMQDLVVLATIKPGTTSVTTTTSTISAASKERCDNGVGNASDGCTPGNARPNDEVVRDSAGNIICTPAPGNPCTRAAATTGSTTTSTTSGTNSGSSNNGNSGGGNNGNGGGNSGNSGNK